MTEGETPFNRPSDVVRPPTGADITALEHELFGEFDVTTIDPHETSPLENDESWLGPRATIIVRNAVANSLRRYERPDGSQACDLPEGEQTKYKELLSAYVEGLAGGELRGRHLSQALVITDVLRHGARGLSAGTPIHLAPGLLDPELPVTEDLVNGMAVLEGNYPADELGRRKAPEDWSHRREFAGQALELASRGLRGSPELFGSPERGRELMEQIVGRANAVLSDHSLSPLPDFS